MMTLIKNTMQFLTTGGPVVIALSVLSVFALALIILKLIDLKRLKVKEVISAEIIAQKIRKEGSAKVIAELSTKDTPKSLVAAKAIELSTLEDLSIDAVEKELSVFALSQLKRVESANQTISLVAHTSPLLGLLGTVLGMISAFQGLEKARMKADPSVLAGGIWEALVTTALGLLIAIPMIAFRHYFEKIAQDTNDEMESFCTYSINRFRPKTYSSDSLSEIRLSSIQ